MFLNVNTILRLRKKGLLLPDDEIFATACTFYKSRIAWTDKRHFENNWNIRKGTGWIE